MLYALHRPAAPTVLHVDSDPLPPLPPPLRATPVATPCPSLTIPTSARNPRCYALSFTRHPHLCALPKVLRSFSGVATLAQRCASLCLGNIYTTSIHAVNSCVLKLSKLTRASTIYRGFAGGLLPEAFWQKNEFNVAGGCEYGFLSTTTQRKEAAHYAQGSAASTVLEMQQGMVNRGAEVEWLSQYPHEKEVLFPPLTGFEVLGTTVEGRTLVVEMRLSLNLMAATLEQVVVAC